MSTTTDKLALFKYDPSTDGAQTFNIKKALNDNWDKLDDAVKEILITLAKKAPAGYGLGTGAVPIDDYNNAVNNGWYRGGTNYPSKINYANYGMIRVDSVGQIKFQTFYAGDTGGAMTAPFMAIRKSIDSGATWSEWEYVNPPMIFGVEYRTTERYMGKPVYVQLVSFGALPNATLKSIDHKIQNISVTFSIEGNITNDSRTAVGSSDIAWSCTSSKLMASTTTDMSTRNAYVKIKYTKTTG